MVRLVLSSVLLLAALSCAGSSSNGDTADVCKPIQGLKPGWIIPKRQHDMTETCIRETIEEKRPELRKRIEDFQSQWKSPQEVRTVLHDSKYDVYYYCTKSDVMDASNIHFVGPHFTQKHKLNTLELEFKPAITFNITARVRVCGPFLGNCSTFFESAVINDVKMEWIKQWIGVDGSQAKFLPLPKRPKINLVKTRGNFLSEQFMELVLGIECTREIISDLGAKLNEWLVNDVFPTASCNMIDVCKSIEEKRPELREKIASFQYERKNRGACTNTNDTKYHVYYKCTKFDVMGASNIHLVRPLIKQITLHTLELEFEPAITINMTAKFRACERFTGNCSTFFESAVINNVNIEYRKPWIGVGRSERRFKPQLNRKINLNVQTPGNVLSKGFMIQIFGMEWIELMLDLGVVLDDWLDNDVFPTASRKMTG